MKSRSEILRSIRKRAEEYGEEVSKVFASSPKGIESEEVNAIHKAWLEFYRQLPEGEFRTEAAASYWNGFVK